MGSTAIRSAVAFPGLRLTGVITSSPDKAGRDAATFAGLDADHRGLRRRPTSTPRWRDCDAVAYMASGDIRPDEAIADIERCLRAGRARRDPVAVLALRPALAPRRSGWTGSPRPPRTAARRCWSAASTRAGATTRSR